MKTFTKIWKIIAIGVIIAAGLSACGTTSSVQLDEETLAIMENASWTIKALNLLPSPFVGVSNFRNIDRSEIAYFENISMTKGLDVYTWYALTAPELPGVYYYIQKTPKSIVLGGGYSFDVYKSTTIDDETFAWRNTLRSVSWEVKALANQPSLNGFDQIELRSEEDYFVTELVNNDAPLNSWFEITAPELPGLTYYHKTRSSNAATQIGTSGLHINYKRTQ